MGCKIITYKMPDGKVKTIMERDDMVEDRLKKLAWANLEVISIKNKRET